MPNRMLREGFLDSGTTNKLSEHDQLFFVRLILAVDDYGRIDGRSAFVRSKCYPVSDIGLADVGQSIDNCADAGVLTKYTVDNKQYLQILIFNQRLRQKKEKYPAPPIGGHVSGKCLADGGHAHARMPELEEEGEVEVEIEPEGVIVKCDDAYLKFKTVYPNNGSIQNPEVQNWFINYPDEDAAAIIESAEQYDVFCRAEYDRYPHAQYIMQAINWLRQKQYLVNWEEKKKAIKRKGIRHFTAEDTPDVQ